MQKLPAPRPGGALEPGHAGGQLVFLRAGGPRPLGAAEAYQWTSRTSGPWNTYLLCYPDRFVEIEFDLKWTPTPAQKVLAGERLGRDAV